MIEDVTRALLAQGVEIRILPGLKRTVWRPAIKVLKLAGDLTGCELLRDMQAVLDSLPCSGARRVDVVRSEHAGAVE